MVWFHSHIWRIQRDKRFRCSIYKQASLITSNKPVPDNTSFPVTTKHGNVCGKLPMATKQRNCVSVKCTSHKLNWVYSIYTVSSTDNPNRSNEAAPCCVYIVEYRWQNVMTLPFTFTHHYTRTDVEKTHKKKLSFDKSHKWTTTYCFNKNSPWKWKTAFKRFTKDSSLLNLMSWKPLCSQPLIVC